MVDSLLLVLHEVLEAAIIVSLLLALSSRLKLNGIWCFSAILFGFSSSWISAYCAYDITNAFEGAGQELLNISLALLIIGSIVLLNILLQSLVFLRLKEKQDSVFKLTLAKNRVLIYSFLIIAVSCAVGREGFEIWLYFFSFSYSSPIFYSALMGALIGAGIGISLGALLYYIFIFIPRIFFIPVIFIMTALIIGGLSMRVCKELMQIGWLDSTKPIWDSSVLIDEHSWVGELASVVLRYDAQPTLEQVLFYFVAIAPLLFALLWNLFRFQLKPSQ